MVSYKYFAKAFPQFIQWHKNVTSIKLTEMTLVIAGMQYFLFQMKNNGADLGSVSPCPLSDFNHDAEQQQLIWEQV